MRATVEVDVVGVSDGIRHVGYLSGSAAVIESTHESLERIVIMLVEPTVGEVRILRLRHIDEAVSVLIHPHVTARIVGENARIERFIVYAVF